MFDLDTTPSDPRLRAALERITSEHIGDDVRSQIALIGDLAPEFPHRIKLLVPADPADETSFRYTCFQHAFDLVSPPHDVVTIATLYPHVFPNAAFADYLTDNRLREREASATVDGDIVIYYLQDTPRHAGRVHSDGINSKWGTAHLWHHGLFEVPTPYGDRVRFFSPLPQGQGEASFRDFAREVHGIDW